MGLGFDNIKTGFPPALFSTLLHDILFHGIEEQLIQMFMYLIFHALLLTPPNITLVDIQVTQDFKRISIKQNHCKKIVTYFVRYSFGKISAKHVPP